MRKQNRISPPKLADRFFSWYCCDELSETILGDLHENFERQVRKHGKWKAKFFYWGSVFLFINRHTLRRNRTSTFYQPNQSAMLGNYILIAFRYLMKNKVYASINILGLAIGMASCLILFFYVKKERSFDQFHEKHDQIFRVTNTFERSSGPISWARTPPALAPSLKNSIPGIERVTRLRYADEHTYSVGDRIFRQGNVFYADSAFLRMFDFALSAGDPNTALSLPNSIVISEEMAQKYFGEEDPMGQVITFDRSQSLEVKGILKTIPSNSHITFDMLISFQTYRVPDGYLADLNSWSWAGFHTYVLLNKGSDTKAINERVLELYKQNFNRANINVITELQPLAALYLESSKYTNVGESIHTGSKSTISGLALIALLILVIAGFNFMNLSTAASLGRGKEIGVRKVMGAARRRVATQFLVESIVISFVSLAVAFVLILVSQPYFKQQLGLDLPALSEYGMLGPLFLSATFIIGVVSGFYPAGVLSSFGPISALKGGLKTGKVGVGIRKMLMVFQFMISLLLIAGSIVVVSQMKYISNKHLGFDQENVLRIRILTEDVDRHYASLKSRFEQHSQVRGVAISSHAFDGSSSSGPARLVGAPEEESYQLAYYQTDHDFMDLTQIELLEGRYFSRDFFSDSSAMLLNERAVDVMGLDEPVGKKITFSRQVRTVIGVVKDFHFRSLHDEIGPMAIVMPFATPEQLLVKIAPNNVPETFSLLESDWKTIVGNSPFDVTFMADGIQQMYEQERKIASLISVFSLLAIVLACLGLYGLMVYAVQAKLKEVGIRKVLGSSLASLLLILSQQFIALIGVAVLIASPLVYYLGDLWLSNFAFRIAIDWWVYAASGLILLGIAMLTISYQTIKAARANPVRVLRNE